jgi:putative hydroxymethylpyrimidine transport system ATP-binding protein
VPDAAPEITLGVPRLAWRDEVLFEGFRFRLEAARWTCLLGPSGVGKTTLLRLIAGLEPGALVVTSDGQPLENRIALMAQQDLLLPWLSARENVLLGPRLRRVGGARMRELAERADELLTRVELAGQGHKLPSELSGGMRQRVALARTLMEDRPVVLMDEPFSALDAVTRHRLQEMAAGLLAGRTVLLVTHNPLEALRLGHKVWVLGGRPAALRGPLAPSGEPARDPADPQLLKLQADLLKQLSSSAVQLERAS